MFVEFEDYDAVLANFLNLGTKCMVRFGDLDKSHISSFCLREGFCVVDEPMYCMWKILGSIPGLSR